MQLMTFNSLLMFDVVFVFFLFLVGVTCLVYYLPPATKKSSRRPLNAPADIECGSAQDGLRIEIESEEDADDSVHYYRQFAHRHHRCPHHHQHHHHHQHQHHQHRHQQQQQEYYDQQLHSRPFMNNRYMPVMTSSSGSPSGSSSSSGFPRSYVPIPSTPPPPPTVVDEEEDEDQGNMEILPPQEQQQSRRKASTRHLYHNILNSAFEQHGDAYFDDDEEEFNMIATNVEILSPPPPPSQLAVSTSLPASPGHEAQQREEATNANRYHLPSHPRPECHTARHVVGICQYHMQQHLRNHQQQHQLHRLFQQQQLLQQFANQQQQQQQQMASSSSSTSLASSASGLSVTATPSIVQNPGGEEGQKKVQYIVVDTTTDRNKKPRPNKYCHVKAQNCDTVSRKCASAGPVDEV